MGRYRSRSRSYSPRRSRTPPSRKRYDDPRDRRSYRDRRSPASSGLLVRNVALDARPEDLRIPFERFGPVKDVYLPKNYYTGEPRGFGFVKFRFPEDAAEAKERLNHTVIGGREIRIVFAEENRRTPQEMRMNARVSGRYGGSSRRRISPRSPRRRYRSYSRSPSPARHYSRSRSVSRSRSPYSEREYRSNRRSSGPRDIPMRDDDYRSSRRSPSSRVISPHDERDYKSSQRSPSPQELPQHEMDSKSKRRSASPREVSLHEDYYRSNKRSPSPHGEKKRKSTQRSASPRDLSSLGKGHESKHRSVTAGKDGKSPQYENDSLSRLESPRRIGRSLSRSRSRSDSPR
ncbi:hypothetical protein Nepgr_010191 [Nepenthes gracilis]|uniref:RRM domain-containing protein n=1 Tax=Nepenthes gracilis TaxID=150966 RepID=A0AAD3SCL8_NEPGR|nr:hypothetical protein Nepgr_010191 [Nepenthes gracilis]